MKAGWPRIFLQGELGEPSLELTVWGEFADPDVDGLSNLIEYFTGNDPHGASSVAPLGQPVISGDEISAEYHQSLSAIGVVGQVEWSADLKTWSRSGVTQAAAGEDESHVTVRARVAIGDAQQAFFRLAVQRAQ
ncbi:MAG: hypothetical protein ACI8XO_002206 [Verrucomicrobiales bacterium]|jgi:hypothetical protein